MKLNVRAYAFTTGEVFLAETRHDAVQMWRVGAKLIALDPSEPTELAADVVVEGLTVAEWRKIGQRGLIDRMGGGTQWPA